MEGNVILHDGREVYKDAKGRWRDIDSNRFVREKDVEDARAGRNKRSSKDYVLKAVREQGFSVGSAEEAFAKIVGVQAEIALEKEGGSKAIQAAKFVAQATGMMEGEKEEEKEAEGELALGREMALKLLDLIEEEKLRRDKEPQMDADEHG
jgi:hypothetical protein